MAVKGLITVAVVYEDSLSAGGDHPLDGYEGATMSQLYVGYMNKSGSQQGSYAVYNTMPLRNEKGATIGGGLETLPISPSTGYPSLWRR